MKLGTTTLLLLANAVASSEIPAAAEEAAKGIDSFDALKNAKPDGTDSCRTRGGLMSKVNLQ